MVLAPYGIGTWEEINNIFEMGEELLEINQKKIHRQNSPLYNHLYLKR